MQKVAPAAQSAQQLNELIVDSIYDIKGKKIVLLDLRRLHDAPADYFIICQGESTVQVRAIADNIRRRLKEELREIPSTMEGVQASQWVLLDYFHTVVHVFHPDTRDFYQLEALWSDAVVEHYPDLD